MLNAPANKIYVVLLCLISILCGETLEGIDTTFNGEGDTTAVADTTVIQENTTKEESLKKKLSRLEKSLLFGVGWSFGNLSPLDVWIRNHESLQEETKDSLNEVYNTTLKLNKLQVPTAQAVTFPISIGLFRNFDSLRSLSLISHAEMMRKSSVFTLTEQTDSVDLYKSKTIFRARRVMVELSYERLFDKRFFNINNVDRSGFSIGGGGVPLSTFSVNDFTSKGYGVLWSVSLFAERGRDTKTAVRTVLGYRGSSEKEFSSLHIFNDGSGSKTVRHNFHITLMLMKGRGRDKEAAEKS